MVKAKPDGYYTVTPYLIVDDLEGLLAYVQAAVGGKATEVHRGPDGKPRHAEVQIGDSKVMMGSSRAEWPARPGTLYLYVDDTDAMYQSSMRAGAKSIMEPADQFYGDRNAGVEDPFGNQWWLATHVEDVAPEELERRMAERG
jgi:PhnB protein